MSGIILHGYHRHLNKKEIQLEKQIEFYKEYWQQAEEKRIQEEKEKYEEDKLYFDEYQIGDTLEFNYNFGFSTQVQEDKWMDESCVARGVLQEKERKGLKLRVKVIQSCDKKGLVYYSNENISVYDQKRQRWTRPKKDIKNYIKQGKSRWFELNAWELE